MAKFTGTIRHNDLEGGFFELVTSSGETYRLEGADGVSDGDNVTVEGDVETGGFGFQMTGSPALKVKSITPA
jgi:hypothetical protein